MLFSTCLVFAVLGRTGYPVPSQSKASAASVTVAKPTSLSAASLLAAEKHASGFVVGHDKKSLSVTGPSARLVVRTGPKSDMMSYRIKGIRNPTIIVNPGARLSVFFVNADDDMLHNLRFTALAPPFAAKIGNRGSVGSTDLHPMKGERYSAQVLTVVVSKTPGTYYYLCTIPGHAAAGMFGKLVVRNRG